MNRPRAIGAIATLGIASIWFAHAPCVEAAEPAAKMLCSADQSTGFQWKAGQWTPVDFTLHSYIITKRDPVNFAGCDIAASNAEGHHVDWTFTDKRPDRTIRKGCYSLSQVGETYSSYSVCEEHIFPDTTPAIISCDADHMEPFSAQAGGPFTISALYGIFGRTSQRDSVFVAIGKCSPLSE